jgi:hypothetical protein
MNVTQSASAVTIFTFLLLLNMGCGGGQIAVTDTNTEALREHALRELKQVLHQQNEWVKVHAAEYLLWTGNPVDVREVFLREEKQFGTQPPYRIGIWRVLAQAASSPAERENWIGKIREAFLDSQGKDRIHASETLAKLKVSPYAQAPEISRQALESENKALALYSAWAMAYTSADSIEKTRGHLLNSLVSNQLDALSKRMAGYILRQLGDITNKQWQKLAQLALSEPDNSDAQVYLLSAAFVQAPESQERSPLFKKIREKLLSARNAPTKGNRIEMAMALAERGTKADIPLLASILSNQNPLAGASLTLSPEEAYRNPDNADIRAAAAYAILKIGTGSR